MEKPYENPMTEKEVATVKAAIESPKFSHARYRVFGRCAYVAIYHRESTSPSGVLFAASGNPTVVDRLLREIRKTSALSPTEWR